jgi:hypothetical protein
LSQWTLRKRLKIGMIVTRINVYRAERTPAIRHFMSIHKDIPYAGNSQRKAISLAAIMHARLMIDGGMATAPACASENGQEVMLMPRS